MHCCKGSWYSQVSTCQKRSCKKWKKPQKIGGKDWACSRGYSLYADLYSLYWDLYNSLNNVMNWEWRIQISVQAREQAHWQIASCKKGFRQNIRKNLLKKKDSFARNSITIRYQISEHLFVSLLHVAGATLLIWRVCQVLSQKLLSCFSRCLTDILCKLPEIAVICRLLACALFFWSIFARTWQWHGTFSLFLPIQVKKCDWKA